MPRRLLTALLLATLLIPAAQALVIVGGNGTGQTTSPGGGFPWDNVGLRGGATGIYLGNYGGSYWALTAAHVGAGNLVLGGNTYSFVSGSTIRVLNGDNSDTDLVLFRLATDPGLPTLTLASTAPSLSAAVTFVGRGGVEGAVNYWQVAVGPGSSDDVWTNLGSNPTGANAAGYLVAGSVGLRWGTNTVSGATFYNIGTGLTQSLYSDFTNSNGDAQGATGDSGGAVFSFSGGGWQLVGVLGAIGTFENQPSSTAVLGNISYFADVAHYNGFITSAIPEPATTTALLALGALAVVLYLRRRR